MGISKDNVADSYSLVERYGVDAVRYFCKRSECW